MSNAADLPTHVSEEDKEKEGGGASAPRSPTSVHGRLIDLAMIVKKKAPVQVAAAYARTAVQLDRMPARDGTRPAVRDRLKG